MQVSLQARGLAAQQLASVGILLLRHERRAGAERVRQRHKAKLRARPEDEILGDARKVHAGQRAGGGELDEHVAVGHGIHGILRHPRPAATVDEAERPGGEFAVDAQRSAGDGPGAQRAPVGVVGCFGQALVVALEHLQPRQKMMRQRHRLRPLEVGVAGNEHVAVRLGHGQQRAPGSAELCLQDRARLLEEEPHVGGHLVVAAAGGVKSGGGGHTLRQRLLDVHVHVLQPGTPAEPPRFNFAQDFIQPRTDGVAVFFGDEADVREHGGVGLAALNVKNGEAPVERHRLAELQHECGRLPGETSTPHDLSFRGHKRARSSSGCGRGQFERWIARRNQSRTVGACFSALSLPLPPC